MAFTGVAALIAAETVTVAIVATAVAEIGLYMTVAGAITGNKDLMKIGGVLSLAGGVGGLAAGAAEGASGAALADSGWSAAMDTTAEQAAASAAGNVATDAVTSGLADGAANAASTAATDSVVGDVANTAAGQAPIAPPATEQAIQSAAPDAVTEQSAASTGNATVDTNTARAGDTVQANSDKLNVSSPNEDARFGNYPAGNNTASLQDKALAAGKESSTSYLDKFMNFAKGNKELVNGGVKLLSGGLQGLQSADQFKQQMALKQQQQDIENKRFANGSAIPKYNGILGKAM